MSKSREDWIRWFTENGEIDGYEINDDTAEFRGYVECVEGTTFVRTQYADRTELFKFYVNNGKGRRMKVLSWGVNAVKWSSQISERSIVTISRAFVHPANSKWKGSSIPNCSTDLKLIKETHITFESEKFLDESVVDGDIAEPDVVLIQDVPNVESNKKIRVIGWIKVPFQLVTCGGGSRGSGVIVDHEWKIRVHVKVYQDKPELVKGMKVSVDCEYNSSEGCILNCQSMGQISPIAGEQSLCEEDLNGMGFYTPKRKSDDDLPNPSKKFSPFD